jgi:Family of unknown function (DUF6318)
VGVRIALAVVVAAVAVAACGGGDPAPTEVPSVGLSSPPVSSSPPSIPPTTAATTPSPPSPTPPALPAQARQDSPTGAESFARYYIAAQDYANRTGDTKLLRSLGNCTGCTSVAEGIERFYRNGGSVEGGQLRVTEADVTRHVAGQAALVTLTYSQAAGVLVNGDGTRQPSPAKVVNQVVMTLARRAGSWTLTNIQGLG